MKLHELKINGFKRIKNATIRFGDATFLIGANNAGKSTTLKAIEHLLSNKKQIDQRDFYSEVDPETQETKVIETKVILEAEFRNVPSEALSWRGFKGRVFKYSEPTDSDTGLSIFYRKTFEIGKDVLIELKTLKRSIKEEYKALKKPQEFIDAGVDPEVISELFQNLDKAIPAKELFKLDEIDSLWDLLEGEEEWFTNPGGIPSVVLNKLPRFLFIPADSSAHEIHDVNKGVLGKTLNELFEDVRASSEHYKEAQIHLDKLASELDPRDKTSEFGKMMDDLNSVLSSVFPESKIHAIADLSDPKVLKPTFEIEMSSNIKTRVENQGTGMVRSAVFGLLRFRQQWLSKKSDDEKRSLIIGFEEPEIYLHPSAANLLRDTIYALSTDGSQIVATTHSPYLIDISRKPKQILNRFHFERDFTSVYPFSVSEEYKKLEHDNKQHVKMLLKLDDYVSRVFFTKRVVIVEGDTEDIVIREALRCLPVEKRNKINCDFEVIKARGKAAIIGLVKYLKALNVECFVIHDRDAGCANAEKFNDPIAVAVGDHTKVMMLEECVEDVLGYEAPSSEKPFNAFKQTILWDKKWDNVPDGLKVVLRTAFSGYID